MIAMLLTGAALIVGAQGPPPRGGFGGGPMPGMFEFGGLMGGLGGKVVTGKPILTAFTIMHTETLPGNTINSTTTGTFARGSDGSTYRDVKLSAIGPWAASGKAQEFAYIRNETTGMQYVVNVTKGTYRIFPIHGHNPPSGGGSGRPSRPTPANETVTDNPSGTYTDSVTKAVYPADDKLVTRTIPAGTIGNLNALVITTERWYSSALDILLEDTHSDPRFGTTTYQLSNIGQSPASSLFTPDPSFTQVTGGGNGKTGRRGLGGQQALPPQD